MSSVVGAIFSENREKILLIQRRDVPVWVLPGGGIEDGETPIEAIIRECKEETGFDVIVLKKIGDYYPKNRLAKRTYFFECSIVKGNMSTGSETRNIRFFPINELPKWLPPPYEDWIIDAYQNPSTPFSKTLTQVNYPTLIKHLFLHPILVFRFLLARMGL
ncbi:MAG: NUDIX hydrolase, partial [Chlamydiota bacterium]